MRPFEPLFRNPHILTILGNFWPRDYDETRLSDGKSLIRTDPDTQVLVQTQRPLAEPAGGSGAAPRPRRVGRCGIHPQHGARGTPRRLHRASVPHAHLRRHRAPLQDALPWRPDLRPARLPRSAGRAGIRAACIPRSVFRWAATYPEAGRRTGRNGPDSGVCAISTPIDLAASVRRIGKLENRSTSAVFVKRMRERLLGHRAAIPARSWRTRAPSTKSTTASPRLRSVSTGRIIITRRSRRRTSSTIRVPTLLIQAKDDIFIPFEMFNHPASRPIRICA
jgi:hypothetical protein